MSFSLVVDEQTALGAAWQLQRTGNFVAVLDLAQESLLRWPGSRAFQYLKVLALASCGSTQAALDALRQSGLAQQPDEDSQALEARLLKDLAFGSGGAQKPLIDAAEAYQRVAERTGGSYSGQNAALLFFMAGDQERARRLSAVVRTRMNLAPVPAEEESAYFHWATLAEAALILGDQPEFIRARDAAEPLCRRNAWARSRTLKQMARLENLLPQFTQLIERWYQPPVGFILSDEMGARWGQGAVLDADVAPAIAYGVGPAGASVADELAAFGIQLHRIYPGLPAFEGTSGITDSRSEREASGRLGAQTWSSLLLDDLEDEAACLQTALGLSLGLADELRAPWMALSRSAQGWRVHPQAGREAVRAALAKPGDSTRSSYAFLFADVVSYSSLTASDTRRYWAHLLPQTAAAVLGRHAGQVLLKKTWGDAVHAVFTSASAAASAALQIQAATAELHEELSEGRHLSFRISLHFGAADQGIDPVEQTPSVYGPQLSLAARIEPVVPPGGIFVTEAFAARLSLEDARNMHCTYVGTTRLAKSYGSVRLLRLQSSAETWVQPARTY